MWSMSPSSRALSRSTSDILSYCYRRHGRGHAHTALDGAHVRRLDRWVADRPAFGSLSGSRCRRSRKCVRRGLEREAMEHAVELAHSSKSFHSMVCRRLEIISHEDCDTDRTIVPFVKACGGEVVRRGADRRIKDGDRQCDPRDGARAEVTHRRSLRCRHRTAFRA